jgi:hypothetical protein
VDAAHLSDMIAHALHWDRDWAGQPAHYHIEAQPLGHVLEPTESLENAGVFDGAWLVLKASRTATSVSSPAASRAPSIEQPSSIGGPTTGRTIKLLPDDYDDSSRSTEEKPSSDFKWKQLD